MNKHIIRNGAKHKHKLLSKKRNNLWLSARSPRHFAKRSFESVIVGYALSLERCVTAPFGRLLPLAERGTMNNEKQDYSVARVVTHTKDNISKFERHNERKNQTYSNMNIDLNETPNNVHYKKCETTLQDLMASPEFKKKRRVNRDAR